MRYYLPSLLVLLPLLVASDLDHARSSLRSGRYRLAAVEFKKVLDRRPDASKARMGLALALSAQGWCLKAAPHLERLRAEGIWKAEMAQAEGDCLALQGDRDLAQVAYEDAILLNPRKSRPWFAITMLHMRRGWWEEAHSALAVLIGLRKVEVSMWIAECWLALEEGRIQDMDWMLSILAEIAKQRGYADVEVQHDLIEAQRLLDLDDPVGAERVLTGCLSRHMRHPQILAKLAEASRRQGFLADAEDWNSRHSTTNVSLPDRQAIAVRVLVDAGDLQAAADTLRVYPDFGDAESLASAWYLARAQGKTAQVATLADRWRHKVAASERTLSQLIPLER